LHLSFSIDSGALPSSADRDGKHGRPENKKAADSLLLTRWPVIFYPFFHPLSPEIHGITLKD
jgi:hypothetical protein